MTCFDAMIPWLHGSAVFPPVDSALTEPNGLLAAGGDLSPERILAAYRRGIFPWFSSGEPILWWSPDPRMVVFPTEFTPSRSLAKSLRNKPWQVRLDTCFADVVANCARTKRNGQAGTWITDEMASAYQRLHQLGYAHSVESWLDGKLVGGLYGMAIGRVFYGESMFAHATDASKAAFAHLCRFIDLAGFAVIDCQMETAHLASLGGRTIPRRDFVAALADWTEDGPPPGKWPAMGAAPLFRNRPEATTTASMEVV